MSVVARIAAPLVWILDASGKLLLFILRQSGQAEERLTDEEVKTIIAEAEGAGVLESEERQMISGVMRLADRSARGLMTPRRDVELINLEDDREEIRRIIRDTKRARLPVQDGGPDQIVGVLVLKDLLNTIADGGPIDIRTIMRQAPVVMDHSDALHVLRAIRSSPTHMALVFDEYGHFEGIVTSGDVLEAIAGSFGEEEGEEPAYTQREDGSYLVAGWMPVDEFREKLGVPVPREARYETVAGFMLEEMNHLPNIGESFERAPFRFEVMDLDGRRIDKVLVSRIG
jgi:putative hemolysin